MTMATERSPFEGTLSEAVLGPHRLRLLRGPEEPADSLTRSALMAPTPAYQVIVADGAAPWLQTTVARLNELAHLQAGWDSYGGQPPSEKAAVGALELLAAMGFGGPAPAISVVPDGAIHLEWTKPGFALQIEISGAEVTVSLDLDDELEEWITGLAGDPKLSEALRKIVPAQ